MTSATTSLQDLTNQQQKSLIDAIRSGECILVLGPYANLADDGRSQRVRLANYLTTSLPTQPPINPDDQDSLNTVICRLLLDPNYNRGDLLNGMQAFYKQKVRIQPNSPYDSILQLGFRTIFSTDPDGRLMREFGEKNGNPLGLYFTHKPQAGIITRFGSPNELTDETPVFLNLLGLAEFNPQNDRSVSLSIGPEEEFRQMDALTSDEIGVEINKYLARRLARCQWYLFIGFNFNSWSLGSIFYFISKLTQKVNDARVFGLHNKPEAPLTDSTVSYYKNLFPNERNKNDIRIINSDAQAFFTELKALNEQFPATSSPTGQSVFVVYHLKDQDKLDSFKQQLDVKFDGYGLTVRYNHNNEINPLEDPFTEEDIQQHIRQDELVLYLISSNWAADVQYDMFFTLAIQRKQELDINVKGILLDAYSLYDPGPPRQLKPAFNGPIKLLNRQKPLNIATDLEGVMNELDSMLAESFDQI